MKILPATIIILITLHSCGQKSNERNIESLSSFQHPASRALSVERLDPRMDKIIAPGELPEILADSFDWSEGPLWLPEQRILIFSDIPNNSVYQWSE